MSGTFGRPRCVFALAAITCALAVTALGLLPSVYAQTQIHRDPFESAEPKWIKGNADVPFTIKEHSRTDKVQHDGQRSEMIQVESKQGSFIHFYYPVGKAPISDELNVGMWVKANRPGIQVMVRVVLPNERDPKSLDDRVTTVLRGDTYRLAGRWQRLELSQPVVQAQREQQLLQEQLKRPVNFKDAYIDMVVLNVYGGPGDNTVWIDDLEVGPTIGSEKGVRVRFIRFLKIV